MAYYIAFIGGMLILVISIAIFSSWWEKKRTVAVQDAARDLGFEYLGEPDNVLSVPMSRFESLQRGRRQKSWNVLRRTHGGRTVLIFDHKYTTRGGKNSHTYIQTVVAIQSEALSAPQMSLTPESLVHRFASALGYQDIDFDEAPEFSKMFLLRGPDESAIRSFFTAAALDALTKFKGVSAECQDDWMLVWRNARRAKPTELRELFEMAFEIHLILARNNQLTTN